jgi:spermidine/putrescine transport system permease protein
MIGVVVYSFASISLVTFNVSYGWTLSNYHQALSSLYYDALVRSIILSLGATTGCLLLGLPLAYFISVQPPRVQRILLVLVLIPFWTSFVVRTYALSWILGPGGLLDRATTVVGLGHHTLLYTPTAIAIGITYSYLPLMVLPIYVSLERIDRSLSDAASDLGATGARVFRRIILPMAAPGIVVGWTIVGIPSLGEFVIPEVLGGGKTLMVGNVISDQFLSVGDAPLGSATAVLLLLAMSAGLIVLGLAGRELPQ